MKHSLPMLACILLASSAIAAPPKKAASKDRATFRYTPTADEQRPVVVEATVATKGSDFSLRLRFNQLPWGEECKTRCANATLLLDTDSNTNTGLKLGKGAPENGADLAVVIQGAREWKEQGADTFLRVKVRQLANDARTVDEGDLLVEMNHRQDPERVQVDDKTVFVLVDATSTTLPSARTARAIYHPAGGKAVQGTLKGTFSGTVGGRKGGKPEILVGNPQ
ncbi:hypothetical protein P2318_23435 [Myxococcaceae bacterium GXIMD 01537]